MNKKVIAGAAAGLAVAGAGGALAATKFTSPQQQSQAVVNDAAKQLGVQPSKLSAALKTALENQVDAAVAAGRLTSAQGAQLKQAIESGQLPLFGGPALGARGFHQFRDHFGGLDAAASYLGVTETQLQTKLESGSTLAAIAKGEGKSVSGLVDAMVNDAKKKLDAAVSAGRLTQAQENQILSDLKSHVTNFVNGARPAFDRDRDGWRAGPPKGGVFAGPPSAEPEPGI